MSEEVGERQAPGPGGAKAASAERELQEGTMKANADSPSMSPKLLKVAERAKRDPQARFRFLVHLLDVDALRRAYERIRKDAAVGVDGVTKEQYGLQLEENLQVLLRKLKGNQYRHGPIRRVHIPKSPGKTRTIGVSCFEDKVVQGALRETLEAIYEQDFKPCSFGFRPKRSAHGALRALSQMAGNRIEWIVETDVQAFFDSIDRRKLKELLSKRVADPRLLRLIGKCLQVGVLDGEEYTTPDEGTTQGSIISPLLGNVYLHYVIDQWFEQRIRSRFRGNAKLIRYADDLVMAFEKKAEAQEALRLLHEQMAKYGLTLHPDKTRIVPFQRPSAKQVGKGPATFDFLGFTHYWRKDRTGKWVPAMKTMKARYRRAIQALGEWCRSHRHQSLKEQHASLRRRLQGHYNYFGVNGNHRSLGRLKQRAQRMWLYWLRRRSQRGRRLTWKRFGDYLKAFPLPAPKIYVQIWAHAP